LFIYQILCYRIQKFFVVEKIGLKEDAAFALFEKKEAHEKCLEPDDTIDNSNSQYLFKKNVFLNHLDDKELLDPVAKDLIYKQAQYNVNSSDYTCSLDEVIKLAGLQMQIVYSNHNNAVHTSGFLLTNENVKNFVPKLLFNTKKPQDWEQLIYKSHGLNLNKSQEDAKKEYINIVKKFKFYGTTFYPPCKSTNNRQLHKVIIGVNYEGIHIFKSKNRELISSHPYTDIYSWVPAAGSFTFNFGNQNDPTTYSFETKQGFIIASMIQTYVDILVKMLKDGDDDEGDEESEITSFSSGRNEE